MGVCAPATEKKRASPSLCLSSALAAGVMRQWGWRASSVWHVGCVVTVAAARTEKENDSVKTFCHKGGGCVLGGMANSFIYFAYI